MSRELADTLTMIVRIVSESTRRDLMMAFHDARVMHQRDFQCLFDAAGGAVDLSGEKVVLNLKKKTAKPRKPRGTGKAKAAPKAKVEPSTDELKTQAIKAVVDAAAAAATAAVISPSPEPTKSGKGKAKDEKRICKGIKKNGERCTSGAKDGSDFCGVHMR